MNRNDNAQGSEDTTKNREAMAEVAEGHRALEEQARRIEATAPATTDKPIEGLGDKATGSEDNSRNIRDMDRVKANTEAIKRQAERVEATKPADINSTGPQGNTR